MRSACFHIWFQFRSCDFTVLGKCWFRAHLAGEWWLTPCLMFQTLSLCMCCSSHIFTYNYIFLVTLDILSVTVHVLMCPKHTDDDSPLFDLMRSVGPGRCLNFFTGFIQCSHKQLCAFFSLFDVFCRCYKSVVLQQTLLTLQQWLHSETVLLRSLASHFLTDGFLLLCTTQWM